MSLIILSLKAVHWLASLFRLIPRLLVTAKSCGLLTDRIVSTTFQEIVKCIKTTHLATFVCSAYECLKLSLLAVGPDILPQQCRTVIFESVKHQLHRIAIRRKDRHAAYTASTTSDLAEVNLGNSILLDEIEDAALQEIEGIIRVLSDKHSLLVEPSSMRKLATKKTRAALKRIAHSVTIRT